MEQHHQRRCDLRGYARSRDVVSGIVTNVEEQVDATEDATSWNVFPNPVVAGELNLPTAGWQGSAQVDVFDLTGRRWISKSSSSAVWNASALTCRSFRQVTAWCAWPKVDNRRPRICGTPLRLGQNQMNSLKRASRGAFLFTDG